MSEILKLIKVNKSFVPETILCFSDSYEYAYGHCERFMDVNILVVFLDVYMLHLLTTHICQLSNTNLHLQTDTS